MLRGLGIYFFDVFIYFVKVVFWGEVLDINFVVSGKVEFLLVLYFSKFKGYGIYFKFEVLFIVFMMVIVFVRFNVYF